VWTGQGLPLPARHRDELAHLLRDMEPFLAEDRRDAPGLPQWDYATAQGTLRWAWEAVTASDAAVADRMRMLERVRALEHQVSSALLRDRDQSLDRLRGALELIREPATMESLLEPAVHAVTELGFDRAILSRVEDSRWLTERVHIGSDADWAGEILDAGAEPYLLDHHVVDSEMVRRKVGIVVHDVQDRPGVHKLIAGVSRSRSYAAAPLIVDEEVIGFLHGDLYYQNRDPNELDQRLLTMYAEGLSQVISRMWLVEQLGSIGAQLLAVREATAPGRPGLGGFVPKSGQRHLSAPTSMAVSGPRQVMLPDTELTRREIEVLKYLADGDTNAVIARRLVVSVGTVKSHVKNILRKLGAQNRVEAAAYWFDLQSGKPPLGRSQRLRRS
jgi:DNA-binding CsgD family transcriptional regulator/GAF domain-containing protein